jgi:hypothetical protein
MMKRLRGGSEFRADQLADYLRGGLMFRFVSIAQPRLFVGPSLGFPGGVFFAGGAHAADVVECNQRVLGIWI